MPPAPRPPDTTHPGTPPAATTVCLFAQFAPDGRIPAHTRHTLAALAGCDLRLHVACSGAREIHPDDTAFLHAIGAAGHPRPNAGLDFGAWQYLLHAGHARGAKRVILANDSVFGPFAPLRKLIAAMDARLVDGHPVDAWGMVESNERVWHLQSWFISLSAAALATAPVRRVLDQDFASMSKPEIILHGELGLGVAMRAAGLACAAAWPQRGTLRRLIPVNPSHFDWRAMLTSGAVPFIKAELLRDNPADIGWIGQWRGVLTAMGGDPAMIDHALASNGARHQPPLGRPRLARRLLNRVLRHG